MKAPLLLVLIAPVALTACGTVPEYAVRPGAPRAEMPQPLYPVRAPTETAAPAPVPERSASTVPAPPPSGDGPTYYKPEPITGAPPPPDEAGPPLRGRQSPGPAMPVRSAPPPALETPSTVVVRPGESLFEVAERVRTPIRAIIDLNRIKPPYDVTPGAVLRIPPPVIYTVRPGDTLLAISRRFSIDPRSLANLNDIALETRLKSGQRLALPALVKDSEAAPSTTIAAAPLKNANGSTPAKPALKSAASTTAVASTPKTEESKAEVAKVEPPETPPPSASSVTAAGRGKFVWPVKGEILSTYGPKGTGQRNDGVNIAATAGEPIKAAAAGEVVYAGNSIPGFGNLVVVKHPGGWTSLYGNLGKMSVKIRSQVEQGQALGVAGTSGAVNRPQVHFELRYAASPQEKARPVDPVSLLPN